MAVKNAKPGRHADGGGLHLLVKESGARSWVYRFMLKGRSRDLGLGPAGPDGVSLAAARDARDALRLKVKAGIDPVEERQREEQRIAAEAKAAAAALVTFKTVAGAYLEANKHSWRNAKHRQQWQNTLATYVYPVIGGAPVGEITTEQVLEILEPIWKTKPETASRVRGRIETILDAAKARGYRSGENPARWRGHIALMLPVRTRLSRGHHKAMPYAKVPELIARLREREAVAALALEFTILTACRTNEVLGARWAEVDLDSALWIVPASRMKAGREHRVPLSAPALDILKRTQELRREWLFPAARGGNLSGMAMSMLLRRMNVDVTVHGFRSSFRDWAAECTNHPHEVAEMALAHTVGSKVERAYLRADNFAKRRRLLEDWAAHCDCGRASNGIVESPDHNTREVRHGRD
jgi:integrase